MKMDSPSLSHENQGYHIQNTHGIGRIGPPLSNSCCLAKGRKELHEVGLRQRRCFNSLSDSKIQINWSSSSSSLFIDNINDVILVDKIHESIISYDCQIIID